MTSIRRRNGPWQVQVKSRHAGSTSKSFHRKTNAKRWAIAQEAPMQSGQWQEKTPSQYTIGDMLSHSLDIVTPSKRDKEQEERWLQRLLKDEQLMSVSPMRAEISLHLIWVVAMVAAAADTKRAKEGQKVNL